MYWKPTNQHSLYFSHWQKHHLHVLCDAWESSHRESDFLLPALPYKIFSLPIRLSYGIHSRNPSQYRRISATDSYFVCGRFHCGSAPFSEAKLHPINLMQCSSGNCINKWLVTYRFSTLNIMGRCVGGVIHADLHLKISRVNETSELQVNRM